LAARHFVFDEFVKFNESKRRAGGAGGVPQPANGMGPVEVELPDNHTFGS
jgi:hypothetical protein